MDNILFIAPLFKYPELKTELVKTHCECKFTKNYNAVEIPFPSLEAAQMATIQYTSRFPDLTIKLRQSKTTLHVPPSSEFPPGLTIIPNFIPLDIESTVVEKLDSLKWDTTIRRRVQHFGYTFKYSQLKAATESSFIPFPSFLSQFLLHPELAPHQFDQITVNEYQPGIGIASHCDTHSAFSDTIAVISLSAPIVMDFVSHHNTDKISVTIPQRSLMFMRGESRFGWRHAIASRKSDLNENGETVLRARRVSLTFRRIVSVVCKCEYSSLCDSQGADLLRPRRMNSG